ncbi:MAG: hypothetical protein M3N07_07190 [Pseudomonadota bacterium]|nr:hypothetical protein [Pseudomonadota bacterium]
MRAAEAASNAPGLAIDEVFALEEAFGGADRRVQPGAPPAARGAGGGPAALAAKIALAADYEAATISGAEDCLQALKADAARLAREVGTVC